MRATRAAQLVSCYWNVGSGSSNGSGANQESFNYGPGVQQMEQLYLQQAFGPNFQWNPTNSNDPNASGPGSANYHNQTGVGGHVSPGTNNLGDPGFNNGNPINGGDQGGGGGGGPDPGMEAEGSVPAGGAQAPSGGTMDASALGLSNNFQIGSMKPGTGFQGQEGMYITIGPDGKPYAMSTHPDGGFGVDSQGNQRTVPPGMQANSQPWFDSQTMGIKPGTPISAPGFTGTAGNVQGNGVNPNTQPGASAAQSSYMQALQKYNPAAYAAATQGQQPAPSPSDSFSQAPPGTAPVGAAQESYNQAPPGPQATGMRSGQPAGPADVGINPSQLLNGSYGQVPPGQAPPPPVSHGASQESTTQAPNLPSGVPDRSRSGVSNAPTPVDRSGNTPINSGLNQPNPQTVGFRGAGNFPINSAVPGQATPTSDPNDIWSEFNSPVNSTGTGPGAGPTDPSKSGKNYTPPSSWQQAPPGWQGPPVNGGPGPGQQMAPPPAPDPNAPYTWGSGGASGDANAANSGAYNEYNTMLTQGLPDSVKNAISQEGMNAARSQFAGQAGQIDRMSAATGGGDYTQKLAAMASLGRSAAGNYAQQARQNQIDFETEDQRRKEAGAAGLTGLGANQQQYNLGLLSGASGLVGRLQGTSGANANSTSTSQFGSSL